MNDKVELLSARMREQERIISELQKENRRLTTLTETLSNRIRELEQQCVVIDRELAEIPIDFDLIPEEDLNKY